MSLAFLYAIRISVLPARYEHEQRHLGPTVGRLVPASLVKKSRRQAGAILEFFSKKPCGIKHESKMKH